MLILSEMFALLMVLESCTCNAVFRRLYKALDKNDIVNGILKEQVASNTSKQLKDGLEFEQAKDWENAFKVYEEELTRICQFAQSHNAHFILEAYCKVRVCLDYRVCICTLHRRCPANEIVRAVVRRSNCHVN